MDRWPRTSRWRLAALASALVVAAACGGADSQEDVVVFAASSLADAFTELEKAFEAEEPRIDVRLNFAGSSALREQILSGAPADVFASANTNTMNQVVEAGATASAPVLFAENRLLIAVPAGNPGGVTTVEDLHEADLFVGVCAPAVPCGALAVEVFDQLGIDVAPDTQEPNVRALLAKVVAGELDAGLVYASDVVSAGDAVEAVAMPESVAASTSYPIVALVGAPPAARAFIDFVLSPTGASILAGQGFGTP